MTRMSLAAALGIAALSLAGCGGGGGSSAIPSGGGGPTTKAALRAGFQNTHGSSSHARNAKSLASSLVPIADFFVPDSNVTFKPEQISGAVAVAYYDTSNGSTAPSPLPSVTWTESGIPTTLGAYSGNLGIPNTIGTTSVMAPTVDGKGTATANASNGDSTTLTFYAYRANALDSKLGGGYTGTQPCLAFANSVATPGTTGDLCLGSNGDGTTYISAPLGMMIVQKTIDQVSAADISTLPSSATTIQTSALPTSGLTWTIVAHTAAGALVKFEPLLVGSPTIGLPSQVAYAYGFYRISSGTSWDI